MFRLYGTPLALLTAVILIVVSACSPQVNYPGTAVMEPALENKRYVTGDGAVLPVRSWLPTAGPVKAVIVALHGFNDYSNAFTAPGTYLSRLGIACYAYDQRGFGGEDWALFRQTMTITRCGGLWGAIRWS